MVGRYPADELWRVCVALVAIAGFVGPVAGHVTDARCRAGTAEAAAARWRTALTALGPPLAADLRRALLLSL